MEVLVEFKECPDCKVDARLMNSIVQEEITKGNMGEGTIPFSDMKMMYNLDPRKTILTGSRLPGARVTYDICTKCGKEFTTKIELGHVLPSSNPGVPPTFL